MKKKKLPFLTLFLTLAIMFGIATIVLCFIWTGHDTNKDIFGSLAFLILWTPITIAVVNTMKRK